MKLKFLGTGGGRFVTGEQLRRSGGIVVESGETRLHVDPGPGALVMAHEHLTEPTDLDGVLVSHAHLDHCGDAEAMVEMMTEVGGNPGVLLANRTALEGRSEIEKVVADYHQEQCSSVETLENGSEHEIGELEIASQQMFHSDPNTQGFKISDGEKSIGFWTDTEFSEELLEFYEGCDVIVAYCSRPRNHPVPSHTSVDELPELVEVAEPNTMIVTHFGKKFLESRVEDEESWLKEQVSCKVVFAEDGMEFPGNRSLQSF